MKFRIYEWKSERQSNMNSQQAMAFSLVNIVDYFDSILPGDDFIE